MFGASSGRIGKDVGGRMELPLEQFLSTALDDPVSVATSSPEILIKSAEGAVLSIYVVIRMKT